MNDTDIFDHVLDFEQQEYTKGETDGHTDAIHSGEMLDNGRQSGFLKGLAYGLEIGFYQTVAEERLRVLEIASTTSPQPSPSSSSTTIPPTLPITPHNHTRMIKWSNQLKQRIHAFPNTNIDPFDFDNEIRELRGLYRLCGSQIGPFRPIHSTTTTTTTSTAMQQERSDRTNSIDHAENNHVFVTITAAAHDW